MTNQDYAAVTASPGFWGRLLMKQINPETSNILTNKIGEEIIIVDSTGLALDDMISLSKVYPDENFLIEIAGEDVFENYVYTYSCSNGNARKIKEGYEYCFGFIVSDKNRLPEGLFDQFKKRVKSHYEALDLSILNDFNNDQSSKNSLIDNKKECAISEHEVSLVIRYKAKNICLTATKFGKTYINVDIKFLDEPKKQVVTERETQIIYDDLPF